MNKKNIVLFLGNWSVSYTHIMPRKFASRQELLDHMTKLRAMRGKSIAKRKRSSSCRGKLNKGTKKAKRCMKQIRRMRRSSLSH